MHTLSQGWRTRALKQQLKAQFKHLLTLALLGASLGALAQPAAEVIGEVEFSHGAGIAQMPGQAPRTLGKGLQLQEGDRLSTAEGATAIFKMRDGTRMTLRPNTEMVLQKYHFDGKASDNSMVLQLLNGGFRALTGLISKDAPNAAKIQTPGATIGVRGTDFDARLCGPECKAEAAKVTEKTRPNAVQASAKLILAKGDINAIDGAGATRKLVDGASVYPGETVQTAARAGGVLIFRDESRMTLGANTRFKVDSFVFDDKNPSDGRFLVSLVGGSMRALTGVIGKSDKRNVGFTTPTATIGIRGTGLDLDCAAVGSCSFFTWLGSIAVTPLGQTAEQVLETGQGLFVGRDGIRPLTAPTLDELQRPDSVPVNMEQLFSSGGVSPEDQGLYVYVRDGHIEITTLTDTLHLGRGETGYAGLDGRTGRPGETPAFIQFDGVPLPNSFNPMLLNLLSEIGKASSNQCR